jgi:hypothetical protein
LPRFLEIWQNNNVDISTDIKGSFIQLNRSAYSTSPFTHLLAATPAPSLFTPPTTSPMTYTPPVTTYARTDTTRIPYFIPPKRDWGFDVGLLSQSPDLFTQRFTTPARKIAPDEFFREVGRDDEWVKTLMCADLADGSGPAINDPAFKPSVCPPPA